MCHRWQFLVASAILAGMSIVDTSAAGDTASNWIVSGATMRDLEREMRNLPTSRSIGLPEAQPRQAALYPSRPCARPRRRIQVVAIFIIPNQACTLTHLRQNMPSDDPRVHMVMTVRTFSINRVGIDAELAERDAR